ncbi:MAG TPA: hypothetical protein VIM12_17740 [Noviherbaspirillum sp.]|jgi:hypothetical protein|uniref:hypothetical protein n=1 Tax=Noviherbaspirillum sp. TaxID=1926288 RepID=UPI002F959263
MKSLRISDLSVATTLGRASMAAAHGGFGPAIHPQYWGGLAGGSKTDVRFDAAQMLNQGQNTAVNNGNNTAFVSGICASVNPSQDGSNIIRLGG